MKRIALLVLALVATTIAEIDEEKLAALVAEEFESDVDTVQGCLKEAEITLEEMHDTMKKIKEITTEDIDEETKQAITKHNSFLACMLQKTGFMEDKTLLTDKIIENIEKNKDKMDKLPGKKELTECINTLNESKDEMTREDMAFGLMICINIPA